MKIQESVRGNTLSWQIIDPSEVDDHDGQLASDTVHFELPGGWSADALHPDVHAVALLLMLGSQVLGDLTVARPVSPQLASIVADVMGVTLGPTDPRLDRRSVEGGRVGLAFSGGVDSTAARLLLPPDTACVFLDRLPAPEGAHSLYRPEAPRAAIDAARERGWEVHAVATDMEYLRQPVGFFIHHGPVESNLVPTLLLADFLALGAVASGCVLEEAYGLRAHRFVDSQLNAQHRRWQRLLEAVGLPLLNPVAGVSEIGTSAIVEGADLASATPSCLRGDANKPCMNCIKCVRKELLRSVLTGHWLAIETVDQLLLSRDFRRQLRQQPTDGIGVYRYIFSRLPTRGSHLVALGRLRYEAENPLSSEYLERWYYPSADTWPTQWRDYVSARLDDRLHRMTWRDEQQLRRWAPLQRESHAAVEELALCIAATFDATARAKAVPGQGLWPMPPGRTHFDEFRPDLIAARQLRRIRRAGPTNSPSRRSQQSSGASRVLRTARRRVSRFIRGGSARVE